MSTKVDKRSHPRRLEGTGLSSAKADVAAGVVRETPVRYSTDKPKDGGGGGAGEQPFASSGGGFR